MASLLDQILALDISEVIGSYHTLKKKGSGYEACCPFHNEKTPSFRVSPVRGIYKCFGCGEAGNAISFVMKYKNLDFKEALKELAQANDLKFDYTEKESAEEANWKEKKSYFILTSMVAQFYAAQLPGNKEAKEYLSKRWNEKSIFNFGLGYAPSGNKLLEFAQTNKMDLNKLKEIGLLAVNEKDGHFYDFFRDRIMFPMHDKMGNIIAFAGRDFSGRDGVSKYINSKDSVIYHKSSFLYGIFSAYKKIREKKHVYLVEGYADLIRLNQIEKPAVLATCGTALTDDQIQLIKSCCTGATIIGDQDPNGAGRKAMLTNAEKIVSAGLGCNIVELPAGDKKLDPDSFFISKVQFNEFILENTTDYLVWLANDLSIKAENNTDAQTRSIDRLCKLILCYQDSNKHNVYVEQLSKIIKPRKAWTDKIKELLKKTEESLKIPETVSLGDFEKYGFYEKNHCYFFRDGKTGRIFRGSNFSMKPLFHVQSVSNAKRLYEIENEFGYKQIIELMQRDLISLQNFKLRVESLGNFIWEAGELELVKLKKYIYEKTDTCIELMQLGWQKHGFFAWSNGIYNGEYKAVDKYGIVDHSGVNYYIPAFSQIFQGEDNLFVTERKFRHNPGKISFYDYAVMLEKAFGENSRIALCFYLASLFRDHIIGIHKNFPLLNLFGPKGTGKTELALSLLQFFGPQPKGPNINSASKPALADHVAGVCNGLAHIDEYKNSIEFEKIEFLKAIYDGIGRMRMNMDKDKKKESTRVDLGVVLCGQEMPTADIALFSRLIFLTFKKDEYSPEEKEFFKSVKTVNDKGLTHITHEVLNHRKLFIENYSSTLDIVQKDMLSVLKNELVEDRNFGNWIILLTAFKVLEEALHLPFTYFDMLPLVCRKMLEQNRENKRNNELNTFWSIVEYMVKEGLIEYGIDFKIENEDKLNTDIGKREFAEAKQVLYLNHVRVLPLYQKHAKQTGEKVLPTSSITYYLQNAAYYYGIKKSIAFKVRTFQEDAHVDHDAEKGARQKKRYNVTRAFCFDYEKTGIDILYDTLYDDEVEGTEAVHELVNSINEPREKQGELDFEDRSKQPPY